MIWQRILFFLFVSEALSESLLTKDELSKYSITMLKQMLTERSIQCLGCYEKMDYINKVYDTQHLPPVPPPHENQVKNEKKKKLNTDAENIEEVLKSLKQNGFGDTKVFTANDFKNMKSSNDLNDLLKREKQQQQPQQHSKTSSSKKRRKNVDVDADIVDLDL